MNDLPGREPIVIDLVYAHATHPENIFKTALYRPDAPFILHRRLANVVLYAARNLHNWTGWTLVLKDGLRTVEAQQTIFETPIIRAHPEWTNDPTTRLFAGVGQGGHPRGMAVDVDIIDAHGQPVDMGTVFDGMPDADGTNPAHRLHTHFGSPERSALVLGNRAALNQAFADAGADTGEIIWPLTLEWWDFRLPPSVFNAFAPLNETDLPPPFRLRSDMERK